MTIRLPTQPDNWWRLANMGSRVRLEHFEEPVPHEWPEDSYGFLACEPKPDDGTIPRDRSKKNDAARRYRRRQRAKWRLAEIHEARRLRKALLLRDDERLRSIDLYHQVRTELERRMEAGELTEYFDPREFLARQSQ